MTAPSRPQTSVVVWLSLAVAFLATAGNFASQYLGFFAGSQVTSYQVSQLIAAVQDLTKEFNAAPKQVAIDALHIRLDKEQADEQRHREQIDRTFGQISKQFTDDELTTARIDGRVSSLEHPPVGVRQPR